MVLKLTDELKGNPDACDHQFHNLVLIGASYENDMDSSYTQSWATMKCLACEKTFKFYKYSGMAHVRYERDGQRIT